MCLNAAVFSALYWRTTEIVVRTLLDGWSQISDSTKCSVARDFIRTSVDAGVHKFTVRELR